MLKKPFFPVSVVSAVLLTYCVLINYRPQSPLIYIILAIFPLLFLWLSYTVIRYGVYNKEELKDDEEWGYQDKSKDELWIF